ncbi:probable ATP-dependent RNA helicase DDX27 [Uloborus diversus]|uniref:probable ATP-dependent RNA helicase DDX27 n=1 Tax=Uloborus diversus TaxID=327109 RepID=UPI002409C005|nr:probable ATP-dependent RNA helicase DDX27 [Uloborus diversus]
MPKNKFAQIESKYVNEIGLIRTLDEDDEVEGSNADSDEEEERKDEKFSSNFCFDETDTFENDAWNDIKKYVKRKASTLEEKIAQIREERRQKKSKKEVLQNAPEIKVESTVADCEEANNVAQSIPIENHPAAEKQNEMETNGTLENEVEDMELSSDNEEQEQDVIKVKEKKKRKKKKGLFDLGKVVVVESEVLGEQVEYDPSTTFQQMNLSRPLQKAISSMNFLHPTPIQAATIPVALMGKDIYGCAATGTGKTAAFMLPVLERLLYKPIDDPVTRVLVILPTRELAVQVYQVSKQLAQFTKIQIALSAGGLELKAQELALRKAPDIIIATPGRLIDHLENTPSFSLNYIEILILDEADRILDEYFAEQMKEIIGQCAYTRQTMLFSATLNDEVKDLAASALKKPVKIFINSNTEVAFNLHQEFIRIRPNRESEREAILAALLSRTFEDRVMVFAQTKMQVHRLYILLGLMGIKVAELHGNMNQPQRLDSLRKFKEEEVDVLVATDVASRGLDIPGVKTVINFTLPCTIQHYIHRVGRTARAGRSGRSVSMVGEKERKLLKEIVKKAKNPVKHRIIPPDIVNKYQEQVTSLEGDLSRVMKEEKEEKEFQSVEKNIKKAETLVSGEKENDLKRSWFQTPAERKKEKVALRLGDPKAKKKKGTKPTTEDRMSVELEKAAQYQARLAKRAQKPQRIRAITEDDGSKKRKKNKMFKKKSFEKELADSSRSSVKQFRYEATHHDKMEKLNKMKMKKNPSKKFKSKSRYRRKK